jgi:ariadne-1
MPPKRKTDVDCTDNEITKKSKHDSQKVPQLLKKESSFASFVDLFENQESNEKPSLTKESSFGFLDDEFEMEDESYLQDETIRNLKQDWSVLTPKDIISRQNGLIDKVAEITCLSRPNCRKLLTNFSWDTNRLEEEYFEDMERLFKKCGIVEYENEDGIDNKPKKNSDKKKESSCSICFEDLNEDSYLTCKHEFCSECLAEYIGTHVTDNHGLLDIKCPERNCGATIDDDVVINILEHYQGNCKSNSIQAKNNQFIIQKFKKNLAESYVVDNERIKWCPGNDCDNALEVSLKNCPYVKCFCGKEFCFNCTQTPHQPATCEMLKIWTKKRSTDEMDAKFIAGFTKDCPKCSSPIVKDGGCQYVVCAKCKHGFCWICMGAFNHQKHNCNAYVPVGDPESERAQYSKFMFYLKRFEIHEQSIKLEDKLAIAAEKTRDDLQNQGLTYNEASCSVEAVHAIKECRNTLKNTYIYGYLLPKNISRPIFEDFKENWNTVLNC